MARVVWLLPALVTLVSAVFSVTHARAASRLHAQAAVDSPGTSATSVRLPAGARSSERDRRKRQNAAVGVGRTSYRVTLWHIHTRELMPIANAPDAAIVQRFLRCRATGLEHEMASEPLSVALSMAERYTSNRIEVLSGFRSPRLNETLRKKGREVASRSRHVRGEAFDFRIPNVPASVLADAIAETHRGGIGIYQESGFVHVDVGPARRWTGH